MEVNFQLQLISFDGSVHKSQILRNNLIENKPAYRRFYDSSFGSSIRHFLGYSYLDPGMQGNNTIFISQNSLIHTLEAFAFSDSSRSLLSQIVNTKDHILRRYGHRTTIRRLQKVVGRQKQETALCLGFHRQRQMNSHLVTVKVCVKRSTYQRMELDRFTFHQDRFKCLDSQSVQGRSTV